MASCEKCEKARQAIILQFKMNRSCYLKRNADVFTVSNFMLTAGEETLYSHMYVSAEKIGSIKFSDEYSTSYKLYKFCKISGTYLHVENNSFDNIPDLEDVYFFSEIGESRRCSFCEEQFEVLKFSTLKYHMSKVF